MPYADLRDFLSTLEACGKLHRISRPVDKDWEIAAVSNVGNYRAQPERDVLLMPGMSAVSLDPSQAPADIAQEDPSRRLSSKMGIDATRKHEFSEIALPPKEHLDRVRRQWESYGFQGKGII